MPIIIVDKQTNKVKTWGYITHIPTDDEYVVDEVYLKQGEDVNGGLKYEGGKVAQAPELAIKNPTEKERLLSVLGISEQDIQKIKKLA